MGVNINEPRGYPAISGVYHHGVGCCITLTDPANAAFFYVEIGAVKALPISRKDGRIFKQSGLRGRCGIGRRKRFWLSLCRHAAK